MSNFLFLFILFFMFSCAPQKKLPPPPSYTPKIVKSKKEKFSLRVSEIIPPAEIDNTLKLLENILKNPNLAKEERNKINTLLHNFNLIKQLIYKEKIDLNDTKKILQLLYNSVSLLEEQYASLLSRKMDISKAIKEIVNKRIKIIDAYQKGKYTDVVNECLELKLKFGADIVDPEIETIFALSLGKIGMLREAIETGEKALKQVSVFPEKEFLKNKLEEWKNIVKEAEEKDIEKQEKEEERNEEINLNLVIINVERLIKQENFEQALAILNEVKVKDEKIAQLKNQAIEGIINRERNKAAKLFLMAKETEQIEKKRKYLEESYRILEALILQYPNSPLIKRVKENLDKVAEEIKNLDVLKEK